VTGARAKLNDMDEVWDALIGIAAVLVAVAVATGATMLLIDPTTRTNWGFAALGTAAVVGFAILVSAAFRRH
jgi:hypothetical protein